MTDRMGAHIRALTPAQARVLLAMPVDAPCDAWARSSRVATLYELETRGLIERGRRGWLDAKLTCAGRAMRDDLLSPDTYAAAAE